MKGRLHALVPPEIYVGPPTVVLRTNVQSPWGRGGVAWGSARTAEKTMKVCSQAPVDRRAAVIFPMPALNTSLLRA